MALQFPFSYTRLNRSPIDASDVFANLSEFQAYLANGPAYAGQIVAVRNATNVPDLYRINENLSYSSVSASLKYAVTITGNGVNRSFNIDHNLNTLDVNVTVFSTTVMRMVLVNARAATVNRVIIDFAEAPNQSYRIVVTG